MPQKKITNRKAQMPIVLSRHDIDQSLPKTAKGLSQYLWLQEQVANGGKFHEAIEFRRRYNHFYRVRRGADWQKEYYALMAQAKERGLTFEGVLSALHQATSRVEASFASKLYATINPSAPVIDSVVLEHVGLKLPSATTKDRVAAVCLIHNELAAQFRDYLQTDTGMYLVDKFKEMPD
ncbi:hypothetical protein WIT60_05860 [Aquabacterium sp. G14]|uniref:hypothetical protein n=1 Tax=Aquabacterium sp. G14 TaxID=3130164 RepID=UPI0030B0252C